MSRLIKESFKELKESKEGLNQFRSDLKSALDKALKKSGYRSFKDLQKDQSMKNPGRNPVITRLNARKHLYDMVSKEEKKKFDEYLRQFRLHPQYVDSMIANLTGIKESVKVKK